MKTSDRMKRIHALEFIDEENLFADATEPPETWSDDELFQALYELGVDYVDGEWVVFA